MNPFLVVCLFPFAVLLGALISKCENSRRIEARLIVLCVASSFVGILKLFFSFLS